MMQLYNTEMSISEEKKYTYICPENDGIHEFIRINFFIDDDIDATVINQYLGLEEELEDGVLYYEEELLNSENFRYKWILEKVFMKIIFLFQAMQNTIIHLNEFKT